MVCVYESVDRHVYEFAVVLRLAAGVFLVGLILRQIQQHILMFQPLSNLLDVGTSRSVQQVTRSKENRQELTTCGVKVAHDLYRVLV